MMKTRSLLLLSSKGHNYHSASLNIVYLDQFCLHYSSADSITTLYQECAVELQNY